MSTRRHTDPVYLQYIWDALEVPSAEQILDFDFVLQYIRNERDPRCDSTKLQQQISNALRDKCIILSGSRYCFQCHLPGPVVNCPTCFRVYHETCLSRAFEADMFTSFPDEQYMDADVNVSFPPSSPCPTCRRLTNTTMDKSTTSTDLHFVYAVVLEKMRSKIPWRTLYTVGYVNESDRNRYFSFKQMNTRIVTEKLRNNPSSLDGYPNRTSVLVDLDLLIHNAAVIYGPKAEMTNTARHIRSVVQKELRESALCVDCYLRSKGGKPDQKQIVEACRRPHQLLWYHHSSWSFRPCKVLQQTTDGYEVICFDGRRERQFVPLQSAVQMTFTATELGLRMTASLKRALDEAEKYSANQRKRTPTFVSAEGLKHADIPVESPTGSFYSESSVTTKKSSMKTGSKRLRDSVGRKLPPQSVTRTTTEAMSNGVHSKTTEVCAKSCAVDPSPSNSSCDTLRPSSIVPCIGRRSGRVSLSSLSDSNDNSSLSSSSSSTSSSDSDYPTPKRPTYRSVAVTSVAKKAVPSSRSSDSTTPAAMTSSVATAPPPPPPKTSTVPAGRRLSHFMSRAVETDSDSDPDSSPLESSSPPPARKPMSVLSRLRTTDRNSTANSDAATESDSSLLESIGSSIGRRMFPSTTKCEAKYFRNPSPKRTQNGASSANPKPRRSNDLAVNKAPLTTAAPFPRSVCSNKDKIVASTSNVNNAHGRKGKKCDATPSTSGKLVPVANPPVVERRLTRQNPLPPGSTTASSISSVSPAALSSSSGIGSSLNGDTKSVDASPGDLLINGHAGALHSEPALIKAIEDRVQHQMNERLEALKLERDRATERLNQLERYVKLLQRRHKKEIRNTKKLAWCSYCLEQAQYYCCGGVAYCSVECQLKDWEQHHCRMCRRPLEKPTSA
ncbi:unnamed protein product [Mesocestoides corti]|uniref:MYND-type domain-containing protein n=1 Tax=Mesocestoides corti TaxID=53468 RepID=A0A0R3UFK3_MESCO|nr:unnamed protein product [Mesocestoides corti]